MWMRNRLERLRVATSARVASRQGVSVHSAALAIGLVVFLYAPMAQAGGAFVPGAAYFGGDVTQVLVNSAASLETVASLGIGIGAPVSVDVSGFAAMLGKQASRNAIDEFLNQALPAAHAYNPPDTATVSYETMRISIGDDFLMKDFSTNREIIVADDQVQLAPLLQELCPVSLSGEQVCDWLWLEGGTPLFIAPQQVVALDDSVVEGVQQGVNLLLTASSEALDGPAIPLQAPGEQALNDITENSVLYIDLIDLTVGPEALIRLVVLLDTVDLDEAEGNESVPALSREGGAFLVLGVGLIGIALLVFPRSRRI